MALRRLKTEHIANKVKDQLDSYRSMGILTNPMYDKFTSFRVLIEAINDADIEVCGAIRQTSQVVVFVPANTSEIILKGSELYDADHTNALLNSIPDLLADTFLNASPWTEIQEIRAQNLYVFSEYPLNGKKSESYVKLVSYSDLQGKRLNNNDPNTNVSQIAYYDATRYRIQLSQSYSSDKFLSFEAYLSPEKIDFEEITDDAYDEYTICAPTVASKLMEYQAIKEVLPIGLDITEQLEGLVANEKRKVASRMPKNHTTLTVEPRF